MTIDLVWELPEIAARFDAKLLHRAVRNLIENALRATASAGGRVSCGSTAGGLGPHRRHRLGPGSPRPAAAHLRPLFSTHDTGTGLGLPIARRIAEEHGGGITARNRPEGGSRSWSPSCRRSRALIGPPDFGMIRG